MHVVTKRCGNCRSELKFMKQEKIQLGQTGFVLGDLPNLVAGALDVEIWCCPECRKLDFFLPRPEEDFDGGGEISQIKCQACGAEYDLDYPKCPFCGTKNANW